MIFKVNAIPKKHPDSYFWLFFKNFQAHSKIYGNAMNSQNYLEKEHILNTYAAWFHVLLESYGNQ